MKFSFNFINNVDMSIYITHYHAKDLGSLLFGRGCNLVWINNDKSMLPTNCMLLTKEISRRRDAEDEARLHATSTAIKDYKAKQENIPKLYLILEV